MSRETRAIPGYERLTTSGAVLHRFAGVEARLKDGDDADSPQATWFIKAATIPGLTPHAGDICWGTDGVVRTVIEVAAINDAGEWPCVCERVSEEE